MKWKRCSGSPSEAPREDRGASSKKSNVTVTMKMVSLFDRDTV
jgi:hypothetical protein